MDRVAACTGRGDMDLCGATACMDRCYKGRCSATACRDRGDMDQQASYTHNHASSVHDVFWLYSCNQGRNQRPSHMPHQYYSTADSND